MWWHLGENTAYLEMLIAEEHCGKYSSAYEHQIISMEVNNATPHLSQQLFMCINKPPATGLWLPWKRLMADNVISYVRQCCSMHTSERKMSGKPIIPNEWNSPFKEKNGDDDAHDEDDGQHRPHHPQQPLLFVNDRLRIHIGRGHRVRKRAGCVHGLHKKVFLMNCTTPGGFILHLNLRSPKGPAAPARRKRTPVRSGEGGCGNLHSSGRRLTWTPGGGS